MTRFARSLSASTARSAAILPSHCARSGWVLLLLLAAALPGTPARAATTKGIVPIENIGPCVAADGCQTVHAGAADCDNSSIQQALARMPALSEIRVVAGSTSENIAIDDRSLHLIGGFVSCEEAEDGFLGIPGVVSTIEANDTGIPAVEINATSLTPRTVVLQRIAVTGVDGAGQGAVHAEGSLGAGRTSPLLVTLKDSRIHDNLTSLGGGVFVRDAQLVLDHSRIEHNEALQRGGGIYCRDGLVQMLHTRDAVADNRALTSGGGLHIDNCMLQMNGGGGNALVTEERGGVLRNTVSLGSGGGIYALDSSHLELGPIDNPGGLIANVDDNRANALDGAGGLGGGALFLTDGSYASITNTTFNKNRAGSDAPGAGAASVGGAIALTDGADMDIARIGTCDPSQIWSHYAGMCTRIDDNHASGAGGAVYASNANLRITAAFISRSASGAGGAIDMTNAGGAQIDSSVIGRSHGFDGTRPAQHAILLTSGSVLLRSLTLVDNVHTVSSIGSGIANLQIRAVLIDDRAATPPPALSFDSSAPPQVFCLNAHESGSFPGTAVNSRAATARWSETQYANLDVHLVRGPDGSSDMIDACSESDAEGPAIPLLRDGDRQQRGFDLADLANIGGPVDVGVDEFVDIAMFADGFE